MNKEINTINRSDSGSMVDLRVTVKANQKNTSYTATFSRSPVLNLK
jgi:hypothetical protein